MAFRLLRTHGYQVSPGKQEQVCITRFNLSTDVFRKFQKGDEFFCFPGQAGQAVTGMYNLYRASQVRFPGEEVLQEAEAFSKSFLERKRDNLELYDKWIIMKDLPGEVGIINVMSNLLNMYLQVDFALKYPFHANLERIATRKYIEQYGTDDVWIGKSLYRYMKYIEHYSSDQRCLQNALCKQQCLS